MGEPTPEIVDLGSAALDELNAEAKALLDTIDGLRALNVGEIVHLPQIIVVGDQSSGKSSVLEAISHVKFPVKGDLCTRFATELVLRKSSEPSVNVSIRFSDEESRRAARPFRDTGFQRDELPRLIEEAKEQMGIRPGSTKGFSKDVLRVEVTGPDVPSLTLVDLPGFFHSETADQSREGKETVNQLVRSYMQQTNSIILAVVSANAQLAGQIVLEEYTRHDFGRIRTLGVITKPDLARAGSVDERKYLQLAQNKEGLHKLALGWHVLRNGAEDEEPADRDEREALFLGSGAWASLPPGNRGVASLRRKLSKVLLDHIRKTLPGLIRDIEENLEEKTAKLGQLGDARTTPRDMRMYLVGIAEEFQRLARDAVSGVYGDKFFGDLDAKERKLRANLRNLNHAFGIVLANKGASQKIIHDEDDGDSEKGGAGDADDVPDYLEPFVSRYDFPDPEVISESNLNSSLEADAARNQGMEFPGVPNKDLVIRLFQRQAQPWRGIARAHVNLATDVAKDFIEQLVAHIVGLDESTNSALLQSITDPFFDAKREALLSKVEELLQPYAEGYGLPLAGEFRDRMSRRSVQRLAGRLSEAVLADLPPDFAEEDESGRLLKNRIADMLSLTEGIGNSEFGTEQVVDMMETYYEMSRRTFAENVVNLAVESCLVHDVAGIFTASKVNLMDDETLAKLAAESPDVAFEREMLRGQVAKLKGGLKMCRQYKPRRAPEASTKPSNTARPARPARNASNGTGSSNTASSNTASSNTASNNTGSNVTTRMSVKKETRPLIFESHNNLFAPQDSPPNMQSSEQRKFDTRGYFASLNRQQPIFGTPIALKTDSSTLFQKPSGSPQPK